MTTPELVMAASGILFGGGVLFAEFRRRIVDEKQESADKLAHVKELNDAKLEAAKNHANLSGKLDMAALLQSVQFQHLQGVTKTAAESPATTIEVANNTIQSLSNQVKELTEYTRHVTHDQFRRFGEAVPNILALERGDGHAYWRDYAGVRILYCHYIESINYAQELMGLFGASAITVTSWEDNSYEALNIAGLKLLIADPGNPTDNNVKTMALLRAADIQFEVEKRETDAPLISTLRVGRCAG